MNVEIHKENYQGYRERQEILDTQRQILHQLSGGQGPAPVPTAPIPYKDWNTSRFDWNTFGKALGMPSDSAPAVENDDDVDDDEEDEDGEEDSDFDE
jgi:hypothetical protein